MFYPTVLRTGSELFSYTLDNRTGWIDIESPSYAERNKDIIDKIILQMSISHTYTNTNTDSTHK